MYGRPTVPAHGTSGSNGHFQALPDPGSAEEAICFKKIQEQFKDQFEKAFPDKLAPKTVVIIPSLTLDQEILVESKRRSALRRTFVVYADAVAYALYACGVRDQYHY